MSHTPQADVTGPAGDGRGPRGPFGKMWLFLRQVFDELRKVIVPTRRELVNYTIVVMVFVLIVILVVSGLDWVFNQAAELIFGGGAAE
ncbi:preprotein translocase subunit SecE [Nesterenkonia sp.]|uniref:preprotein translocase subunit SecE n=1 Tax=Nesterenkonia sp. TaxID=704201 RepID=UPI002624146D|nr:preprotein translocase subunit SecE [Nesterenkonia sp.]